MFYTRKMVPIKGRAKVKLFDVHALCHFDVRKASFSELHSRTASRLLVDARASTPPLHVKL